MTNKRMSRASATSAPDEAAEMAQAGPSRPMPSSSKSSTDTRKAATISTSDSDDSDSDAAPEEESNTTSKSHVRANEEIRRAELKKKQEARRKAAATRQQRNEKQKSKARGTANAVSESEHATKDVEVEAAAIPAIETEEQPDRLDPALFASAFAAPARPASILKSTSRIDDDAQALPPTKKSALARAAEKRHREKRRGGIVRGRDGQPMRRVDGNTTVRVLDASSSKHADEAQLPREELLQKPAALTDIEAGPDARARAFKKRRLGLKGKQAGGLTTSRALTPKAGGKKKKGSFDEDDPLGLEDPAFMKGGEFEGLGLSGNGKKKRSRGRGSGSGGENKRVSELRGADSGRRKGSLPISRNGGVIQFVQQKS